MEGCERRVERMWEPWKGTLAGVLGRNCREILSRDEEKLTTRPVLPTTAVEVIVQGC
jgi:hypothetical protein